MDSVLVDHKDISNRFDRDGYVLIENLIPPTLIDELKNEISRMVDYHFDPIEASIFCPTSLDDQQPSCMEYFLGSSDKIRYFLEKDAWNPVERILNVEKKYSLNKIGHALHWFNPAFKRFTFSERFKLIAQSIGLIDPLVVQSMVIFKNPSVGSEVPEHQDATYLYAKPEPMKVVGFWIPLENATETNGCLQFIPGSHRKRPLEKRWIRTTDPLDGRVHMKYIQWPLDGKQTQKSHSQTTTTAVEFKSLPAKIGDCVLIDGLVVHRSDPNLSKHPRPAYTFHVFDQGYNSQQSEPSVEKNDTRQQWQWDSLNWLQPSDQYSFPRLYSIA